MMLLRHSNVMFECFINVGKFKENNITLKNNVKNPNGTVIPQSVAVKTSKWFIRLISDNQ